MDGDNMGCLIFGLAWLVLSALTLIFIAIPALGFGLDAVMISLAFPFIAGAAIVGVLDPK